MTIQNHNIKSNNDIEEFHELEEKQDEEEEEDWSNIMNLNGNYATHNDMVHIPLGLEPTSDDNDNYNDSYSERLIHKSKPKVMSLFSVQSLTPLDMVALCSGSYDATGNRVWMAAHFFVKVFAYDYISHLDVSKSFHKISSLSSFIPLSIQSKLDFLIHLRRLAFRQKRVLELGCGTGCSGISLLLQHQSSHETSCNDNNYNNHSNCPSFMTFTDSDLGTLDLCDKNCRYNNILTSSLSCTQSQYAICQLTWSEKEEEEGEENNHQDSISSCNDGMDINSQSQAQTPSSSVLLQLLLLKPQSYHTTIATDVIYDVAAIKSLMCTASRLTEPRGYFILSHVPRADYDTSLDDIIDDPTMSHSAILLLSLLSPLEQLIVKEAQKVGFQLVLSEEEMEENEKNIHSKTSTSHLLSTTMHSSIIRPSDMKDLDDYFFRHDITCKNLSDNNAMDIIHKEKEEDEYSFDKMHDVGAAIFIFRKR